MTRSGDLTRIQIRYEWRLVQPRIPLWLTARLLASRYVKHVHILSTGKEIEIEAGTGPVSGMIFCWDCGANAPPLIVLQAELLAG